MVRVTFAYPFRVDSASQVTGALSVRAVRRTCVCVCVCRVVCVFGGHRYDNVAELTRVGGEMVYPENSPDYIATT